MPAELTRANLDQWKRSLKLQLQQKTQKLNSLHTEVNSLLSGMQTTIDTVTANLQAHQGQPKQLAKSLMQEFNKRSEAVQNLDTEICKLVKQMKELQCKVAVVTKRSKTDLGALIAGHTKPNRSCTVEDSILPAKQPNVLGFPVSQNQFQILSEIEAQESELTKEQNLEDPRKTRAQRLQVSSRAEGQETLQRNDAVNYSPPVVENEITVFPHSLSVSAPDILDSQSGGIVQNLLEPGAIDDDALYINDVNDVACTDGNCNKRISVAGPERSAGRPGHMPTRRNLACRKNIEDSCMGQDWSAGRPGIRPFAASSATCPFPITACLGPYGNASRQPHHTGPNTREETLTVTSSTRRPRQEDQSTIQLTASSSQRSPAAEDRASSATVALYPCRPPYFCGDIDDDVHIWTSIVSRWLDTVQGEPSKQLTYVVSLLRGAAIE